MAVTVLALLLWPLVIKTDIPNPASEVRANWNSLFMQVFAIAMVVAVVVWGLLIYAIIRFRAKEGGPKDGPHIHGNTKLEIAWTLAPTMVFAWLLVLSFNGLFAIEDHPDDPTDFTVGVEASQFSFSFIYPDGTRSRDTLYVEEDKVVEIKVTSLDVIHAFSVQELGVMIDAVPGRENTFWFKANEPGTYPVKCREMCGIGHSRMAAAVEVQPAGTTTQGFGKPATAPPAAATTTAPPPSPSGNATNGTNLTESPSPTAAAGEPLAVTLGAGDAFAFDPADIAVEKGKAYTFQLTNVQEGVPHNLYIGPAFGQAQWQSETIAGPESTAFTATFTEDATYEFWCNVPGHYQTGMKGIMTVGAGGELVAGPEPLLPGPGLFAVLGGLAVALAVFARRRA